MLVMDLFNFVAGLASIVGLCLTVLIFIKINQYKRTQQFVEDLKRANTEEHKYRRTGLAMKIDTDASIEENLSKIETHLTYYKNIAQSMNKYIQKQDNKVLWEERVVGLTNHALQLDLLLAHVEIQCLEMQYLTSTIPMPCILNKLNKKRKRFIQMAQTAMHVD